MDVTSNNNAYIFNALLNLPDDVLATVLVDDNLFVLDGYLSEYVSTDEEKEYYKQADKFYDKEEIVDQPTVELKAEGTAFLRTDYALDDIQYGIIAEKSLLRGRRMTWIKIQIINRSRM